MFFPPYFLTGRNLLISKIPQNFFSNQKKTYPDLIPGEGANTYIPRIYGFKIYKKKGSRYFEQNKATKNLTYFGEDIEKKEYNFRYKITNSDDDKTKSNRNKDQMPIF